MTPVSYNISIPQRASFTLDVNLKDGAGTPLNMGGYTVKAQIWNSARTELLAEFTITWIDRSLGKFNMSMSSTTTTNLKTSGVWDILTIDSSGKKDYWMRGKAILALGYTDEG